MNSFTLLGIRSYIQDYILPFMKSEFIDNYKNRIKSRHVKGKKEKVDD
nr:hypothetical protein [uncultured Methanolobus sp.]